MMAAHVEENQGTRSKRPKRKSGQKSRFLAKAKKFGKQGKLGHGYEIDSDTYNYFLRVHELCQKNQFETEEEKSSFIINSFEQTVNEEVNLASNQMVSRVLEGMLDLANEEILERFCTVFTPNLRTITTDPFASHVLEKLLEVTCLKWKNSKSLTLWFRNTSKYVLNNYEEFVFDNFANRVMRKVLQCLTRTVHVFAKNLPSIDTSSKLPARKSDNSKNGDDDGDGHTLRKKDFEIVKEFHQQFLNWPQFFDLFHTEITSGFVQNFVQVLNIVDNNLAFQIVILILKAIEKLDLENNVEIHALECCITISNASTYELMYNKYFKGKIEQLALHPKGHHTVRKLITAAPDRETFEAIFDTIEEKFADILQADYTNIFVAFAESCKRLGTRQSEFIKGLSSILIREEQEEEGGNTNESFVEVLVKFNKKFKPRDDGSGTTFFTDLNGSIVLQHLLEFHKPFKVVSCLLEMETSKLLKLIMDPKGSHIMDSFFKSSTVGDKRKEKMLTKLQDVLSTLACNKFGSRVMDALWSWANIKYKGVIAASLSERQTQLNGNQFGKFISEKCGLHAYKTNPKQWTEFQNSSGKRKAELDEFVSEFISPTNDNEKDLENESVKTDLPQQGNYDDESVKPPKKKKKKTKANVDE